MGWAAPKCNEAKDETPFRYAHAEIRTQVVGICDQTLYQLDQQDAIRKDYGTDHYMNSLH